MYRNKSVRALIFRAGKDFAEALGCKLSKTVPLDEAVHAMSFCVEWYTHVYYDYDDMDAITYNTLCVSVVRYFNQYTRKHLHLDEIELM